MRVPRFEVPHSHYHFTVVYNHFLKSDMDHQTDDGVFFVSMGVPRDFSLEASKAFI